MTSSRSILTARRFPSTDFWTFWLLLLLAAAGWAWTLTAGDMSRMSGMAGMSDANGAGASFGPLAGFMLGWVAMMAAMMFPAIIPVVRLYRLAAERGSVAAVPWFVSGYLLVWSAVGLPAYVAWRELQAPLAAGAPGMARLAGLILVAAAIYQLSPLKTDCLHHCRSPMAFFFHHGRSLRTRFGSVCGGIAHGTYCLGCCWLLMAILVAFGTMHLGWMITLSALIVLEKAAPGGELIARGAAAVFGVMGAGLIFRPEFLKFLI